MTTQTMVQCKRVTKLMGNRFEFTIIVEDVDFGEGGAGKMDGG